MTGTAAPGTARPDNRLLPFVGRVTAAGVLAAVATLAAWLLLRHADFAAFTTSNVLRGLSTVATVAVIVVTALVIYRLADADATSRAPGVLVQALCWLAPAGLIVAILAVPLASTHLYLGGSGVDQAFRTQFLTRMTDAPGFGDMTYDGMPSFYPRLWFLTGGIFAKITGMAGWAAYQPWALATLAAAAAVLVPVWQRLTGSLLYGTVIAVISTAVLLATAPEEPYSAIVALGMPAALVLADRAMRGSRVAMVGLGLYLGVSANTYTLFTGVSALAVVAIALAVAWSARSARSAVTARSGRPDGRQDGRGQVRAPLLRLLVTGLTAVAVALVGWAPYLVRAVTADHPVRGQAQHYLPEASTEIPLPFFQLSLIGLLSVACLIWIVLRWGDRLARSIGIGVLTCYAWMLLSMLAPLVGTTLLAFRVTLPLLLILATGGVLALGEGYRALLPRIQAQIQARIQARTPVTPRAVTALLTVILALATTALVVRVPSEFRDHQDRALFEIAYTDTDGDGVRADGQEPDQTAVFGEIDRILRDQLGEDRSAHVVLTDEANFMSYYPYHGYQALTAHYANPLARFGARNEEIEAWTRLTDPASLTAAMERAEQDQDWRAPDALLLHGQLTEKNGRTVVDGTLVFHMVDDIFPNEPNVRFRDIAFPGTAFGDGTGSSPWALTQVGEYVVAVRQNAHLQGDQGPIGAEATPTR